MGAANFSTCTQDANMWNKHWSERNICFGDLFLEVPALKFDCRSALSESAMKCLQRCGKGWRVWASQTHVHVLVLESISSGNKQNQCCTMPTAEHVNLKDIFSSAVDMRNQPQFKIYMTSVGVSGEHIAACLLLDAVWFIHAKQLIEFCHAPRIWNHPHQTCEMAPWRHLVNSACNSHRGLSCHAWVMSNQRLLLYDSCS